MNKYFVAALAAVSGLALSSNAWSQENSQGGFTGPSIDVITVEQAKNMSDDTFVVLRGNVKQDLGDETYVFTDSSGTINVEIDQENWKGAKVGPEDLVEIRGEVDKGWSSVEIDVDQITKVSN